MSDAREDRIGFGAHHDLVMDGFIFAGTAWLVLALLAAWAVSAVYGDSPPEWVQALNLITIVAPIAGGVAAAWWATGREVDRWSVLGGVAAIAVGLPLGIGVVTALVMLMRPLGGLLPGSPMQTLFGFGALVAIALFVPVVVRAVRDLLPGRRSHPGLDVIRLVCVAVVLALALVVAPAIAAVFNPEIAEAGAFALMFALAGAFGTAGADAMWTWRHRRPGPAGSPAVPA